MTQDLLSLINASPLPFARQLGLEVTAATLERIEGRMTVKKEHCTVPDILHGGAVMAMADTLGAIGTAVNLPPGAAGTTTIESKTNFLGSAPIGTIVVGVAEPIHRGKRTQVWQTRISREDGKPVALVTQTQLIL